MCALVKERVVFVAVAFFVMIDVSVATRTMMMSLFVFLVHLLLLVVFRFFFGFFVAATTATTTAAAVFRRRARRQSRIVNQNALCSTAFRLMASFVFSVFRFGVGTEGAVVCRFELTDAVVTSSDSTRVVSDTLVVSLDARDGAIFVASALGCRRRRCGL